MITRVKLTNWKSHLASELKFSGGTNALVGSMGSGKSSILQAVCFGLFGDLPELRGRKVRLDDLIMRKPMPKGFAEIEVEFQSDGGTYVVKRRIETGRGTTLAEIREGGRLVETNGSKVTGVVERILKVDYELFSLVVYSEQNQLDYFLTVPKGRRMEKIDSMLRIDRLEEARKTVSSLTSAFGIRMSERESFLKGFDEGGKRAEFQKLTGEIAELEVAGKNMTSEIADLKSQLDSVRKRESELEGREKKKNGLEKEEHLLKSRLSETEGSTASLAAQVPREKIPEEPERALIAAEEQLTLAKNAERDVSRLEQKLGEAEGALRQLSSRRGELLLALGEEYSKKPVESLEERAGELSKLREEKKKMLSGMEAQIESSRKSVLELERRLAIASREAEERAKLALGLEEKKRSLASMEVVSSEHSGLAEKVERLSVDIGRLDAHIAHLSGDMEELGSAVGTCPLCESALEPAKKDELVARKKSGLDEANSRREASVRELSETRAKRSLAEAELSRLNGISEECLVIGKRIESLSKSDAMASEARAQIAAETERAVSIDKSRLELSSELDKLEKDKWNISTLLEKRRALSSTERGILDYVEKSKSLQEQISPLKARAAERAALETRVEFLENAVELLRLEKVASDTKLRLGEIGEEILALAFDPQELKGTRDKVNSLGGALGKKQAELESIPQLVAGKKRLSESIGAELSRAGEYGRELKTLKLVLDDCKILQNAFRETQLVLRREFVKAINDLMGESWSSIYPYGDFSGVRFTIEQEGAAKGDYSLQLHEKGGWVDVEGMASGGERSLACLALRIALARVLVPNLRWLVLDEPTHNLDDRGISELAIALRERIAGIIDQAILITHEERLEPAVTGYCYKLERDKARDEPTKVTMLVNPVEGELV